MFTVVNICARHVCATQATAGPVLSALSRSENRTCHVMADAVLTLVSSKFVRFVNKHRRLYLSSLRDTSSSINDKMRNVDFTECIKTVNVFFSLTFLWMGSHAISFYYGC